MKHITILLAAMASTVLGVASNAQEIDYEALCADNQELCSSEIVPDGLPETAIGYTISGNRLRGAPNMPVAEYAKLDDPDIEFELGQEFLAETLDVFLTNQLTLGEPAATNFLVCNDPDRIDLELWAGNMVEDNAPLRVTLREDNCRFGIGNVCHNCGVRHFYFHLFPVYRNSPDGGALDFYLWPNWILLTSPPGGRELPFWISIKAMEKMWQDYFIPRFDQPSGFRNPLFSVDLTDRFQVNTKVTLFGQDRPLAITPTAVALQIVAEKPFGERNGKLVVQAKF